RRVSHLTLKSPNMGIYGSRFDFDREEAAYKIWFGLGFGRLFGGALQQFALCSRQNLQREGRYVLDIVTMAASMVFDFLCAEFFSGCSVNLTVKSSEEIHNGVSGLIRRRWSDLQCRVRRCLAVVPVRRHRAAGSYR